MVCLGQLKILHSQAGLDNIIIEKSSPTNPIIIQNLKYNKIVLFHPSYTDSYIKALHFLLIVWSGCKTFRVWDFQYFQYQNLNCMLPVGSVGLGFVTVPFFSSICETFRSSKEFQTYYYHSSSLTNNFYVKFCTKYISLLFQRDSYEVLIKVKEEQIISIYLLFWSKNAQLWFISARTSLIDTNYLF